MKAETSLLRHCSSTSNLQIAAQNARSHAPAVHPAGICYMRCASLNMSHRCSYGIYREAVGRRRQKSILEAMCVAESLTAAGGTAQASALPSDCQSVQESVNRIWPVAAAKAALIAADAGLAGSSKAPSGALTAADHVHSNHRPDTRGQR